MSGTPRVLHKQGGKGTSSTSDHESAASPEDSKIKPPTPAQTAKMLSIALSPLAISLVCLSVLPNLVSGKIAKTVKDASSRAAKTASAASLIQIFGLMWLRTVMNYQYRHGVSFTEALRKIYAQGGIKRFYNGLYASLAVVPLSRFFDTVSNGAVQAVLEGSNVPVTLKTALGSAVAAVCRILLQPLDTLKTELQVSGAKGLTNLHQRCLSQGGPNEVFFRGTAATVVAAWMGHFPWFFTRNALEANVPIVSEKDVYLNLLRNAGIGISSSFVSDVCTNMIRVIKTRRQTCDADESLQEAIQAVLEDGGIHGLLFRGLSTKVLANAINSVVFTFMLRHFNKSG